MGREIQNQRKYQEEKKGQERVGQEMNGPKVDQKKPEQVLTGPEGNSRYAVILEEHANDRWWKKNGWGSEREMLMKAKA